MELWKSRLSKGLAKLDHPASARHQGRKRSVRSFEADPTTCPALSHNYSKHPTRCSHPTARSKKACARPDDGWSCILAPIGGDFARLGLRQPSTVMTTSAPPARIPKKLGHRGWIGRATGFGDERDGCHHRMHGLCNIQYDHASVTGPPPDGTVTARMGCRTPGCCRDIHGSASHESRSLKRREGKNLVRRSIGLPPSRRAVRMDGASWRSAASSAETARTGVTSKVTSPEGHDAKGTHQNDASSKAEGASSRSASGS